MITRDSYVHILRSVRSVLDVTYYSTLRSGMVVKISSTYGPYIYVYDAGELYRLRANEEGVTWERSEPPVVELTSQMSRSLKEGTNHDVPLE